MAVPLVRTACIQAMRCICVCRRHELAIHTMMKNEAAAIVEVCACPC